MRSLAESLGVSKHGGVLVLLGDDHTAKSSTLAHQSEFAMVDAQIPVLNPSNIQDLLDFGLIGWELSRYSGLWVSMKCITANIDSSASIYIDPNRIKIETPDFEIPKEGCNIRWPDEVLAQETRISNIKIPAAIAFAKKNNLNKVIWGKGKKKIGLVATGKGYADLRQSLEDLGIDIKKAESMGIHLLKIGMSWPLEPSILKDFSNGMDEIVVIEEKRSLIENQARDILYNMDQKPTKIVGKYDEHNNPLISQDKDLKVDELTNIIAQRITGLCETDSSFNNLQNSKNFDRCNKE